MGSMIYLSLGRLEVDWGKNFGFADHSALFQPSDLKPIPYYYADDLVELKEGLSRPLGGMVERMNLLGHTLKIAEVEFNSLSVLNRFSTETFPFEALSRALVSVDVEAVSTDYGESHDIERFFRREIFPRLNLDAFVDDGRTVMFEAALGMENLSAYSVLQLLAQNPRNLELPVAWSFADVERGGWANRETFIRRLDSANRFLIVTEGSSDAAIIKHALELLRPGIADFFDFVDMGEGYPFSGTGNLVRFVQGLISISVQNRIVVLVDNDAEGVATYQKLLGLNLLPNMTVLRLPDLPEFTKFRSIGPQGETCADINGRAAAIECYLDLGTNPIVRWTNFIEHTGSYQGVLLGKREAMMAFHEVKDSNDAYDLSKLQVLLDHIVQSCVAVRELEVETEFAHMPL